MDRDVVKCKVTRHTGLTLLEMLVALVLVVLIVSCIYGSYYATSRSAARCRTAVRAAGQAQKLLSLMTRQIRCCYVPEQGNTGQVRRTEAGFDEAKPSRRTGGAESSGMVVFQAAGASRSDGEILRVVTTAGWGKWGWSERVTGQGGLHESNGSRKKTGGEKKQQGRQVGGRPVWALYRFDRASGEVWYAEVPFLGGGRSAVKPRHWIKLAGGAEKITWGFFDGRNWRGTWDGQAGRYRPAAVRIMVTMRRDSEPTGRENGEGRVFQAVAVPMSDEPGRSTVSTSRGEGASGREIWREAGRGLWPATGGGNQDHDDGEKEGGIW